MIALDTNVLVRYLTQDDPAQSKKATAEIESAAAQGSEILISTVVICELVWVLEAAYRYGRGQIAGALEGILRTAQFIYEDKDLLLRALSDYQRSKGDFADHVIGRTGQRMGSSETVTFDRNLKGDRLFRVL